MKKASSLYTYRQEPGYQIYGCRFCDKTFTYPNELKHLQEKAEWAIAAHVKKCHHDKSDLTAEGNFLDSMTKIVEESISNGVEPASSLVMIASTFTGAAAGLGLSQDQAIDIIKRWWPSDDGVEDEKKR